MLLVQSRRRSENLTLEEVSERPLPIPNPGSPCANAGEPAKYCGCWAPHAPHCSLSWVTFSAGALRLHRRLRPPHYHRLAELVGGADSMAGRKAHLLHLLWVEAHPRPRGNRDCGNLAAAFSHPPSQWDQR